jgi:hypothetical protein
MPMKTATMCLLAILVADPLAGWKYFNPKDGGFRVKTPGVLKKSTREVKAGTAMTKITLWGIEQDGIAYMVIRSELPPDAVAGGPKKTLDDARDNGVRNSGGKLREEKEIELGGHPGREIILDLPDSRVRGGGIYRSRSYLVGTTHYQVITVSPKAAARPDEMTAFLKSFRLNEVKQEQQGDGGTKQSQASTVEKHHRSAATRA